MSLWDQIKNFLRGDRRTAEQLPLHEQIRSVHLAIEGEVQDRLAYLEAERQKLQHQVTQLEEEKHDLTVKLSAQRTRDQPFAVAGEEATSPRIVEDTQQLRDQRFLGVFDILHMKLGRLDPNTLPWTDGRKLPSMTSTRLTERQWKDAVFQGWLSQALFAPLQDWASEQQPHTAHALHVLHKAVKDFEELLLRETDAARVKSLLEKIVDLGMAVPNHHTNFVRETNTVATDLATAVQRAVADPLLDFSWLDPHLKALVKAAQELVWRLATSEPTGRLFWDPPGTPFDESRRHQVAPGCVAGGVVLWTMFPGVEVGKSLQVPATVVTG